MADRPETEALIRRLAARRAQTIASRPTDGSLVSGDVPDALMGIVRDELAHVLPDLNREEVSVFRWMAGIDVPGGHERCVETLARVVSMIERAAHSCARQEVARG
jgi:hypothetical protein